MLSRQPTSSGRQVENVEEETEAAVAREMLLGDPRSRGGVPLPEVIDLTEHKIDEEEHDAAMSSMAKTIAASRAAASAASDTLNSSSARDALPPLQLRLSGNRASLQPSAGISINKFVFFTLKLNNFDLKLRFFNVEIVAVLD